MAGHLIAVAHCRQRIAFYFLRDGSLLILFFFFLLTLTEDNFLCGCEHGCVYVTPT